MTHCIDKPSEGIANAGEARSTRENSSCSPPARMAGATVPRGVVPLAASARHRVERVRMWLLMLAATLLGLTPAVGVAEATAPVRSAPLSRDATGTLVAPPLPRRCLGDTRSLIVSSGMPYTPVRVQERTGFFVVDLGADGSSISPTTFLGGQGPKPMEGTSNRFAGFDFFGAWAPLTLSVQDQSGIRGPLPQAGLIGTDLIRTHVLTLDYANGLLHRSSRETFCGDDELKQAGFRPLSSREYFGETQRVLRCPAAPQTGSCPNIPSIPVRIGEVEAIAQVDTGYDDGLHAPSLNLNRAWFEQLQAAGVALERMPAADLSLSSCVPNQTERVLAYRLPVGSRVELVGSDGQPVRSVAGVTLYLKDSPAVIRRCGGIGTWQKPAGQLGASFVNDGTLVVDPFSQRLWFRGQPTLPSQP